MPITLTNHEAYPTVLEEYPIVAEYIQGGHGTEIDFYNPGSKSILPGEPVIVFGRVCISKELILPGTFGTLVHSCWISGLVDPDLSNPITQGALVYFDLDLATGLYPGYFTNVQPTNGWFVGHAVGIHATPQEVTLTAGTPVAASTTAERVFIQLTAGTPTAYGTVTNFLATA
jgi:hypothetical protein